MESAKLEKITVPAQSVEASAEDTVDRLKKHPCGSQLAWMLFRAMDEEKFLSFFDSLMPLNAGPIDHLLNETQCMGFLLKRFASFEKSRVAVYALNFERGRRSLLALHKYSERPGATSLLSRSGARKYTLILLSAKFTVPGIK